MGCATCLKCLLIFVNIFFAIIGLILLGVGIFLLVGASKVLNEHAADIIKGIGNIGGNSNSTEGAQLDISVVTEPVGIALIVVGSVIAVLALMGAFGACCDSKPLLIIYVLILLVLISAQVILTALFFTGQFNRHIKETATTSINEHYVGIDDFGVHSLVWNFVMVDRQCCGLNNYKDFETAKKWQRERTYAGQKVNLTTPIACCKLTGSFPSVKVANEMCAVAPSDITSNWGTGCWGEVTTFLSKYRPYAILAVSLVMLLQAIIASLAIGIVCSINNKVADSHYY